MQTGLVKAICMMMLLVFLSATSLAAVHAQDDPPVWAENLVCDPAIQKYQGLAYCIGIISSNDNQSYTAHVIVVDLNSPGMRIEYVIAEGVDKNGNLGECKDVNRSTKYLTPPRGVGCDDPDNRDWYPVMSLDQAVQRLNSPDLAVVINGDYSACTTGPESCKNDKNGQPTYRDHGPEGLTVVKGNRLDGPMNGDGDNNVVKRPWLVISQDAPLRAEIHQSRYDDGSLPYDWVWTGVGGAPWLIQNGEIVEAAIRNCEGAPGSCYDGASQTAVGLTQDGRWLFFVLGVKPAKLLDLAQFMDKKLDAWRAIKFDGGGSSQLYYAGASETFIERGDGRLLTNYLAIIAQPGSGIFPPEESPKPPPATEPGWLDQLWQSILQAWQDIQKGIEERWQQFVTDLQARVEEFFNELQRWLIEWIETQLQEFVNQLCGAAALPTGIAILCWASWKRRR